MKILRTLVLVDMLFLTFLGFWMLFHPYPFPVVPVAGRPFENMATLRVLGTALGGLGMVVLASSALPRVIDPRRLGLGLSAASFLLAGMMFIQQTAIWESTIGWLLVVIPLALAVLLAWAGLRPLKPEDTAAELAALEIPQEIRRALLSQIGEAAAQEERNRLARDLHDSIKQQLFSINVGTATAQERWERDPQGARTALADVRRSAREAMVEMQALLHQLRPEALGSVEGLVEALREQCEALGYRSGAEVTVELGEKIPDDRLPPGAPEALFRIAQEALANVARHARAGHVRLWLGRERDNVLLRVSDDGQGFDPGGISPGMGLRNLRERAESLRGGLEIASARDSGTRVAVRIPLVPPLVPAMSTGPKLWDTVLQIVLFTLLIVVTRAPFFSGKLKELLEGVHPVYFLPAVVAVVAGWAILSRRKAQDPALHRRRSRLSFVAFGGLFWGFDPRELWREPSLILVTLWVYFLVILVIEVIRTHQSSGLRRFWRKESRIWLWLVLLVEAEILFALGLATFAPNLLTFSSFDVFFLLLVGLGFVYAASRGPRLEGAST
jgi:signal transduction histidine kinase